MKNVTLGVTPDSDGESNGDETPLGGDGVQLTPTRATSVAAELAAIDLTAHSALTAPPLRTRL